MVIQTGHDDKQTVWKMLQSVIIAGLSVSVPNRPAKFPGQSVTFTDCVLESENFITDRP